MNASIHPSDSSPPASQRISEFDERLLQRCLDNELTPTETRQLMLRLETLPGGWKTLACGFLEDRLFAQALRRSADVVQDARPPSSQALTAGGPASSQALTSAGPRSTQALTSGEPRSTQALTSPGTHAATGKLVPHGAEAPHSAPTPLASPSDQSPPSGSDRRSRAHWWSHSLTSMSLCAAIAFVSGLLVPDLNGRNVPRRISGNPSPVVDTVQQLPERPEPGRRQPEFSGHSGVPVGNYSLQILPGGSSTENPVSIPVVNDPVEWSRGLPLDFDRNTGSGPRSHGAGQPEATDSFQLIRIPMDDQKDILMFVRDRAFIPAAQ